jgi:hypothetical protein
MGIPDEDDDTDASRRADLIAARLTGADRSFAEASRGFEAEYQELLGAISRLGARYAFDRDGRPAAIAAVREALPVMERDLFDAIVDDHACEVAAVEEALYRLTLAYGRRRKDDT